MGDVMDNFPLKSLSLLCAFLLGGSVQAETVTYSGKVNAVNPKINLDVTERPYAFVKDFYLEVQKDAEECDLLTSRWEADNTYLEGAKPLCLFEWTGVVNGLEVDERILRGVLTESDTVSFGYQVSILNQGQQHVLINDTLTVDVASPVASEIVDIIANWDDVDTAGSEQENYDRNRRLNGITAEVVPRPYPQLLRFDEEICVVGIDESTCRISANFGVPGDGEPEAVGTFMDAVEVLDTKEYLTPAMEIFSVDYDYRSPEVVDFIVNGIGTQGMITHEVAGTSFEIEQNEALLVVRTPHSHRNDDWWRPIVEDIRLVPDDGVARSETIQIMGEDVTFPVISPAPNQDYRVKERGEWEQYGEYFVMRYDVQNVPDAQYTAKINVTDSLDNQRLVLEDNNILDRFGSPIVALLGGEPLRPDSTSELYFQSDLLFAAYGGWEDGTSISSITRNGESLPYTPISNNVIRLDEDPNLPNNTPITIDVESTDGAGNLTQASYNFNYNPASFDVFGRTETVYQSVQSLDLKIFQLDGARCTFAATPEVATEFVFGPRKGCIVEFISLPSGVSGGIEGRNVAITGATDVIGEHELNYNVRYYNADGSNKVVFEGKKTITVEETPPIKMTLSGTNQIQDGVYSVPYDATRITRFEYEYANADVTFKVSNGTTELEKPINGSSRFMMRSGRMLVDRLMDSSEALWKRSSYTVTGEYDNLPNMGDQLEFDVVVTPHSGTEAFLELKAVEDVTSSDMVEVSVNVGFYDRREDAYTYDAQSMGDWLVQVYADNRSSSTPITQELPIDENGHASLTMSALDFFNTADMFYVVARSQSDIEGFDMELRSRNVRLEVLKGSAVEGSLREKVVSDEIPFRGILSFEYATVEDRVVKGESYWEKSEDGQNWTPVPDSESERLFFEKEIPTETQYRYRTVNKYTGVEGYSEVARVIGYEKQEFTLDGPRKLLVGQTGTFSVSETGSLVGPAGGIYEYSTDDKNTWTEFVDSFEHTGEEDFAIYVRAKLDTAMNEAVGDEAFQELRWLVRVEPAERIRMGLSAPRSAEVDFPVELVSTSRYPNAGVDASMINEFVLPDGTVVQQDSVEYIIKESDVVDGATEFVLRSWIDGYKDESYGEERVVIPTLKYTFPETQLFASRYYALAPTEIRLTAVSDRVSVEGVEFTYNWLFDENKFDMLLDNGEGIRLLAKEPGLHEVELIMRDNRGNELRLSELLAVESAPPSSVELNSRLTKRNMRVPISATINASIDLSHRQDRVVDIEWLVNGQAIDAIGSYQTVDFTESGSNDVTVRVTTEFGQQAEETISFEFLPNLPPTCEPIVEEEDDHYNVVHNCSDSDGKISKVSYLYEIGSNEYVAADLRFKKTMFPTATVEIIAVDDGGEESTYTVSW